MTMLDKTGTLIIVVAVIATAYLSKDHRAILQEEYNAKLDRMEQSQTRTIPELNKIQPAALDNVVRERRATKEEVCMAQILFSESKDKTHWVYLGWAVRNRVDLSFRGDTYCEVAHWRGQFSAISYKSDPNHTKIHNIHNQYIKGKLTPLDRGIWEEAIQVGRTIMSAHAALNPVPDAVFFWYVPAYESGNINWPTWAHGKPAPYVLRKPKSKEVAWAFYTQNEVS